MKDQKETVPQGTSFRGIVVKAAMKDTVTVAVPRYVKHPKYKKFMRTQKKYLVHNPGNTVRVGDHVLIRATRPRSKRKFFEIAERLSEAVDIDA